MFERLLRAIYRPQNTYCISLDHSAAPAVQAVVRAISACFDNVFLPVQLIDVEWGKYSLLEAELVCMEELLLRYKKWKYFINLTGQEFPLKSNLALVKILSVYNGANNLEGSLIYCIFSLPCPFITDWRRTARSIVLQKIFFNYFIFFKVCF